MLTGHLCQRWILSSATVEGSGRIDIKWVEQVIRMTMRIDVNVHDFFTVSHASSRGHSCKLFKERFLTDFGKFSFGNRVVNEWNLLTQDLVDCSTVEQFKIKVDHHLRYGRGFI